MTGTARSLSHTSGWRAWFFREQVVRKTTWKARLALGLCAVLILAGPVRLSLPGLARALVEEDVPGAADLIVVETSENPSFASIQHAAMLYRTGVAPRIAITRYRESARLQAAGIALPRGFDRIVDVYCEEAGLDPARVERIHVDVIDPVTLNVARQVADYCARERVRRLVVVGAPFHSRRSGLSYRRHLKPHGIELSMSPAWSGLTPENWWSTKDGVAIVLQESVKLVRYAALQ